MGFQHLARSARVLATSTSILLEEVAEPKLRSCLIWWLDEEERGLLLVLIRIWIISLKQ